MKLQGIVDYITDHLHNCGPTKLGVLSSAIATHAEYRAVILAQYPSFLAFIRAFFACEVLSRVGSSCIYLISLKKETKANTKAKTPEKDQWTVIKSEESCRSACNQLMNEPAISVDCEIVFQQSGPSIAVLQIACGKFLPILFDVFQNKRLLSSGLKDLLENTEVLKVLHNCHDIVTSLFREGVKIHPVMDSQISYDILKKEALHCSLPNIVKDILGEIHPDKQNPLHKKNPAFWTVRPLSIDGLSYAALDVKYLFKVMERILADLSKEERQKALLTSKARVLKALADISDSSDGLDSSDSPALFRDLAQYDQQTDQQFSFARSVQDDYNIFLSALPPKIVKLINLRLPDAENCLIEIIMDLERPVRLIRRNGPSIYFNEYIVDHNDMNYVLTHCGTVTDSNRACVGSSLHRCSVILDAGDVVGMTIRVSRIISGLASTLKELLIHGKSVLLVGAPGSGKTTLLRDIAKYLASEEHDRRVMIVDTNNEIAGENTLPHRAIGNARRMKVGDRINQHSIMLEAVQNHTPQILVIDEIGTHEEANEAVSIGQRGIQLIATTHGSTLADVIQNPHTRNLLGGCNTVILSAGEREREGSVHKTRVERKTVPVFQVCIELLSVNEWRIHHDVSDSVDVVLRQQGDVVSCELRQFDGDTVSISTVPFPDRETSSSFQLSGMSMK